MRQRNKQNGRKQKRAMRRNIKSMPQKTMKEEWKESECKYKKEIMYNELKRLSDTYEIFLRTVYGEEATNN